MGLKTCLIVLPLLLTISCTKPQLPLEIASAPIDVTVTAPPRPSPIVLDNITWKVITYDENVYYALRVADYQLLASDMLEIKRYISAQKNIISYYEQTIKN